MLISGLPGAGKTTVARRLAEQLPRSVHIIGDDLRRLIIGGFRSPAEPWDAETRRQYYLAFENEAALAKNFIRLAFKVIVDELVHAGDLFEAWKHSFQDVTYSTVLLQPAAEEALRRNRRRTKHVEETIIRRLDSDFRREDHSAWLVLDTTRLSVDETVSAIRKHLGW